MVQQIDLFPEMLVRLVIRYLAQDWVFDSAYLHRRYMSAVLCVLKSVDSLGDSVVNTPERLAHPQRPVHGVSGNAQHVFDLPQQLQWFPTRPVHFVIKREDRNFAHSADRE